MWHAVINYAIVSASGVRNSSKAVQRFTTALQLRFADQVKRQTNGRLYLAPKKCTALKSCNCSRTVRVRTLCVCSSSLSLSFSAANSCGHICRVMRFGDAIAQFARSKFCAHTRLNSSNCSSLAHSFIGISSRTLLRRRRITVSHDGSRVFNEDSRESGESGESGESCRRNQLADCRS